MSPRASVVLAACCVTAPAAADPGDATATELSQLASSADDGGDQAILVGVRGSALHLQVDLLGWRHWRVGVAAGLAADTDDAVAYVAHTGTLFGPLGLRLQAGIGAQRVTASAMTTVAPLVSGDALATLPLGSHLSLVAGPHVASDGITALVGLELH